MSLPSKKRKLSDEASLPPIDVTSPKAAPPRKDSGASATSDDTAAMALKALSALDAHHSRHPLKKRKASLDSSMESDQALGLAPLGSNESATKKEKNNDEATPPKSNKGSSSTALDHLDALGDDAASLESKPKAKVKGVELTIGDEAASGDSGLASSNQRVLLDALLSSSSATAGSGNTARRDRLESWGGMSDLSATGFGGESSRLGDAAAALAASALHYTGLIEDVTAAAYHPRTGSIGSLSSGEGKPSAVPSRISLADNRKMSVASEFSMFGEGSDHVVPHLQAFVDAAMATVGDQLEDLAGAVEMAAYGTDVASVSSDLMRKEGDSDVSSTVSPLIGTVTDFGAKRGRARSLSTSSKPLSVDLDAVAAAVDAAQAATGALDLSAIAGGMAAPPPVPSVVLSNADSDMDRKPAAVDDSSTKAKSSVNEKDMEAIRARARKAAGYVLSTKKDETPEPRPPLKKRPKQPTPDKAPSTAAVGLFPDIAESTPRVSNMSRGNASFAPGMPMPPLTLSSNPPAVSSASRAASQKWDDMFEGLVQFAADKKAEETKGMSEKEKEEWVWDGNVPTSYKTPDGKKLGRWVNNQRTSKTKGTLKPEREAKLVSTGLRWSTLAVNSWQDMMNELHLYVAEKTKNGQDWDGNVPASYKIKREGGTGEDKNLGRWVNRQRSAKQNGKLQKEREDALNAIGLRWAVLSTASWDDMYNVLCDYVKQRKAEDPKGKWDGNVPSNYKTNDSPPKALGRWVNRQRSNYGKKKLKKEYTDKLQALGLKWSVHDRNRNVPAAAAVAAAPAPPTHVVVKDSNKEVSSATKSVPKPTVRRGRSLPLNRDKDKSERIKAAPVKMKAAV